MTQTNELCFVPNGPLSPMEQPASESPTEKRIRVRVSLFFDGTANNRVNTDHRIKATSQGRSSDKARSEKIYEEYGEPDNSYANDHSNVSRLEKNLKNKAAGYDVYVRVYTEGIGTTNEKSDSTWGMALGTGPTGVQAKVEKGIKEARTRLMRELRKQRKSAEKKDLIIEKLSIDTCGFSRGAAAARHCIHRICNSASVHGATVWESLKDWLEHGLVESVEAVEVRAVGLFDTVASFSVDHSNDTFELQLDAVREAKAVLQLCAAEEYRVNFPLTNINAALAMGVGRQVYLPGSHSDIGGGYPDGDAEDKVLVTGSEAGDLAKFLLERGWCSTQQLELKEPRWQEQLGLSLPESSSLSVNRARIRQEYSFIPLQIMAKFMREQALPVSDKLEETYRNVRIPSALVERIKSYADAATAASQAEHWEGTDPDLRALRRPFLHLSLESSLPMRGRFVLLPGASGRVYRLVREVFDG